MDGKEVLCTIGFSQKSLRKFVELLREASVTKVIDVRLHNTSQLAGYAKKDDLEFILEILGIKYQHVPELAPTEEILQRFKKVDKDWESYTAAFLELLEKREAIKLWKSPVFDSGVNCLLCAEHFPKYCHRRLVAEYFASVYPEIEIRHLI
ncbi:MAG TPA: DUF488 domain-containing protein [Firmicutes bacterium]|nr:DUF488 domain-containing protein [Bacillota bacterium]